MSHPLSSLTKPVSQNMSHITSGHSTVKHTTSHTTAFNRHFLVYPGNPLLDLTWLDLIFQLSSRKLVENELIYFYRPMRYRYCGNNSQDQREYSLTLKKHLSSMKHCLLARQDQIMCWSKLILRALTGSKRTLRVETWSHTWCPKRKSQGVFFDSHCRCDGICAYGKWIRQRKLLWLQCNFKSAITVIRRSISTKARRHLPVNCYTTDHCDKKSSTEWKSTEYVT